jgi:hypothetical protein
MIRHANAQRAEMMDAGISVEAATTLMAVSRRTLWRRIEEGQLRRLKDDTRGRALVDLQQVVALSCIPLDESDIKVVERADAGDAEGQNDLAMLFLSAGEHRSAVYWLDLATKQNHADAMQLLAECYFVGTGVEKDPHLGFMWLAKAAASGHRIAQKQLASVVRTDAMKANVRPSGAQAVVETPRSVDID